MTYFLLFLAAFLIWGFYLNAKKKKTNAIPSTVALPEPEQLLTDIGIAYERPKPDPLTVITPNHGGPDVNEWKLKGVGEALTIYKTDFETVKDIRTMLDANLGVSYDAIPYSIRDIIAQSNLRVKEVDEYVQRVKPGIEKRIREIAEADPEWSESSELNKKAILEEAKGKAYKECNEVPFCELDELINGADADPTIDDRLYAKYSPLAINTYGGYADKVGRVYRAPADSYNRSGFDELVKYKLAQQGSAITTEGLLESMTLKQMNELRDPERNPKAFTRKPLAIEQLSGYSDIRDRVEKVLPTREMFQILPADADLSAEQRAELGRARRYDHALASIIGYTYAKGSFIANEYDIGYARNYERY